MRELDGDILVLGAGPAGPAGLAAARAAAESGRRVLVLDDNPAPGGQIWRGGLARAPDGRTRAAFAALADRRIDYRPGWRLIAAPEPGSLLADGPDGARSFRYERLILAGGARERFLPFPGWTLPGVFGLGGLQALAKQGLPVSGKRIVLAGTGPLLLAVAATLKAGGARVLLMAEQAPFARLARFTLSLTRHPAKLAQAAALRARLWDVAYPSEAWVVAAQGRERLEAVRLSVGGRERLVACDYLGCAYGLLPNSEPGEALGCALSARDRDGAVAVDDYQGTSQPEIYAAGELCGIGGVDKALLEGRIAGLAAAGRPEAARALFDARDRARDFAARIAALTALRPELKRLARPDTILCRCEDVPMHRLQAQSGWREAKLLTRCGMGACQGRICGPMTEALFGWERRGARPPLEPIALERLCQGLSSDHYPSDC